MKSIQDALDAWDYEVDLEPLLSVKDNRSLCSSLDSREHARQRLCEHPKDMTVKDFLQADMSTIGDACGFFRNGHPAFSSFRAFYSRAVNCENALDAFEEGLVFELKPSDFTEQFLTQRSGKSLGEVFEEKLKACYSKDLKAVKAGLDYCLTLDGIFTLPKGAGEPEAFSYVKFRPAYSRSVLTLALEALYGQVAKGIFLVPTHLIEKASMAELSAESPSNFWHHGWVTRVQQENVARDPQNTDAIVEMFGRFPLSETFPASETDDASMFEALNVFARTMTLSDAVKTSRVV